jgi:hypothetical protein
MSLLPLCDAGSWKIKVQAVHASRRIDLLCFIIYRLCQLETRLRGESTLNPVR